MKFLTRHILAWSCVLCLLLSGCQSAHSAPTGTAAPAASGAETTVLPSTGEITVPTTLQIEPAPLPTEIPGTPLTGVETAGKVRLPYTGNRASVQYVTAPDQLPEQEGLEAYDEAYFADHALLLIIETVGSGSVQVELDAIYVDGDTATVVLSHELPGDAGTADMATWLLWVEVDAGLSYQWTLDNPALPSDTVTE